MKLSATALAYSLVMLCCGLALGVSGLRWILAAVIGGVVVGELGPRLRPPITVVVEGVIEEEDSETVVVEQWVVTLTMPFWANEDAKTRRALDVQNAIPLSIPMTTRWRDGS